MELIKPGVQYDFMKWRWHFLGASLLLLVLSAISFIYPGPKLGTDFKGGTEIEVDFTGDVSAGDIRHAVEKGGFDAPEVVSVAGGTGRRFMIRVQEVSALTEKDVAAVKQRMCLVDDQGKAPAGCEPTSSATEIKISPGGDKIFSRYDVKPNLDVVKAQVAGVEGVQLRQGGGKNPQLVSERDNRVEIQLKSKGDQLLDGLRSQLGADKVPESALRVEWIGPKAGAQLRDAAIKSVAVACFFIMVYIAFRFDLRFAPGGIIALVHDVGIAMGAMVIARKEITLSTVAAMLTIVGYSITDTVVVYDRIRENLGKHRTMSFATVINTSISEMFGRTLISSGVTSFSLIAFLIWGTGALKDFAFALLVGIAVGTYSSIYIAAPFTEWIDRRFFGASADQKKAITRTRATKRAKAVV